jgi:hypothetical protein
MWDTTVATNADLLYIVQSVIPVRVQVQQCILCCKVLQAGRTRQAITTHEPGHYQ